MENKSLMSRSELLGLISKLENQVSSMRIAIKSSCLVYDHDHSCLYEELSEQDAD